MSCLIRSKITPVILVISCVLLFDSPLQAAVESSGLRLNPTVARELDLKFRELPVSDEVAADRAQKINLAGIRSLYLPATTPYRGEITSVEDCAEEFKPIESRVTFLGHETDVLIGGVSSRKAFGACRPQDIAYLGAYFLVRKPNSTELVEVRALKPATHLTARQYHRQSANLLNQVKQLFTR